MMKRRAIETGQVLSMASRIAAAVAGGYALTSLLMLALSLSLPWIGMRQAEAVVATTAGSFLVYAAVIMAVFRASSASRAWLWLAAAVVPLALTVVCLLPATAP